MRKLTALLLLFCLCALTPAQKNAAIQGSQTYLDNRVAASSPTCYLDPDYNVTVAAGLVSSWCCRNAPSICFVQATDAAKPRLSRGDSQENRLIYSDTLSNAIWVAVLATKDDATHFSPSAQYGYVGQDVTTVAGITYRYCATMRAVSGNTNLHMAGFNSASSNTVAKTVTGTLADYCANFDGKTGGGAVTFAIQDRNAAGLGQVEITKQWVNVPAASTAYLKTTTYPQFAGLNGRRVVNFDGVDDVLASTTTGATVFGASAKTILQLGTFKAANSRWFQGVNFAIYESQLKMRLYNNDGTGDEIVSGEFTAGKKLLFAGTHDGSYLRGRVNGVTLTPVASGATSALTSALSIGGVASAYMAGAMGPVILWNKVLPDSQLIEIERGIMKRYGVN